jgi:hypothetical protein
VFAGGALAAGPGARNRVSVYNTAGGTRVFYLSLPDGYAGSGRSSSGGASGSDAQQNASRADSGAASAQQLPALPLLIAIHGGAAYGDGFLTGAHIASRFNAVLH